MDQFDKKIQALEAIQRNKDEIIINIVKGREHILIEANLKQLFSGIDSEGKELKPLYAASTIKQKKLKGQPTNRVTLKDTGEFYGEIKIVYGDDYFALYSDDPKAKFLIKKYGKYILGIVEENLNKFINDIRPEVYAKIKEAI